jgi:hypothetical protein
VAMTFWPRSCPSCPICMYFFETPRLIVKGASLGDKDTGTAANLLLEVLQIGHFLSPIPRLAHLGHLDDVGDLAGGAVLGLVRTADRAGVRVVAAPDLHSTSKLKYTTNRSGNLLESTGNLTDSAASARGLRYHDCMEWHVETRALIERSRRLPWPVLAHSESALRAA